MDAAEKEINAITPDFKTLHDAIVVDLKNRLEQLGINDVPHIIDDLAKELVDHQSLFVMLSV